MAFGKLKRKIVFNGVNRKYLGLNDKNCQKKNKLLRWYGFSIGEGTRIVGPMDVDGKLIIGENVFIGKNFSVYGNGTVEIGSNCDIAPSVTFLTGTHEIGDENRRAGNGKTMSTTVGEGTWIGARSLILPGLVIGKACVISAGAVVTKDVPDNVLVAGIPAQIKKRLD